ncbi:MAG: restriction endonuclease [Bacteroidetes bacterium 4572_114]|nr:MAG: restriction endonuclease [Bacteroidetes bacterium 4572_114]
MNFIKKLTSGKSQIAKDLAFCSLLKFKIPSENKSFTSLFNEFDKSIQIIDNEITTGALSNTHGDWYEWLLAITAWNHFISNKNSNLAILLPNVYQFDVTKLYIDELNELIKDLKEKVASSSDVELISSNPDFVIIDNKISKKIFSKEKPIIDITPENLSKLQSFYLQLVGFCEFNDIVGFVSIKTSFRPDRRLQIAHEGSLMKALYVHLQTRQWILKPKGLKYYAMSTKVGPKDRDALKTVATHSITTVHSLPQAAVDEVYEVNSIKQARATLAQILS